MSALERFDEEQAVLAAALGDVEAWRVVMAQLTVRDFTDERHRVIYSALATVTPTGRHVDVLPVVRAVRAAGTPELGDYVSALLDVVPTFDPLPNWITALIDATLRRRSLAALSEATTALGAGVEREDVARTLDARLMAIRSSAPDARVYDDKHAMAAAALDYLHDDGRSGTPYGFAPWDSAVLPPQPGHLVLFGGASGSGKSTIARNVLRQWVARYRQPVGWLTCEMTGEEQLVHLTCIDSEIPVEDYYRRRLSRDQEKVFKGCMEFWRDTPLLKVNELGHVTPETALGIFRRWREQGVTHFVLDHLHRLDYGASKSGDDLRVPVAAFARSLKTFAKDSQSLVLALVQYSKIKPHEEPGDEKIREANNILEESDAVFHIYQPLVACERDAHGIMHPLTQEVSGLPYFEADAPKGSSLGRDPNAVYVKLGKQRRRLRDGLIRIPFNHRLAVLYDTIRTEPDRHHSSHAA